LNIASAVLGASIHAGRHQQSAIDFVAREAKHLNALPAAFFSVSLSAGSRDPSELDAARHFAADFVRAAQWEPRRVTCFAGKLAYTQYGFFKRWIMRWIAAREGAPTDTSRDYDFTDWKAVREFALSVAADAREALKERAAL
jgi:menaquinone-dependent protoporphyrinogen oxidase